MKKTIYTFAIAALLFSCKEGKVEEVSPKDDGIILVTKEQFES